MWGRIFCERLRFTFMDDQEMTFMSSLPYDFRLTLARVILLRQQSGRWAYRLNDTGDNHVIPLSIRQAVITSVVDVIETPTERARVMVENGFKARK